MACKEVLLLCCIFIAALNTPRTNAATPFFPPNNFQEYQRAIWRSLKDLGVQIATNKNEQMSVSNEILRQIHTLKSNSQPGSRVPRSPSWNYGNCQKYWDVLDINDSDFQILGSEDGGVYYFNATQVNWRDAEQMCRKFDSNLITLHSKAQLYDLDAAFEGVEEDFWLASVAVDQNALLQVNGHRNARGNKRQLYQCKYNYSDKLQCSERAPRGTSSIVCVLTEEHVEKCLKYYLKNIRGNSQL